MATSITPDELNTFKENLKKVIQNGYMIQLKVDVPSYTQEKKDKLKIYNSHFIFLSAAINLGYEIDMKHNPLLLKNTSDSLEIRLGPSIIFPANYAYTGPRTPKGKGRTTLSNRKKLKRKRSTKRRKKRN